MRINVKLGEERKKQGKLKIRRINLVFPNAVLKSRLALKVIRKGIENKREKGKSPVISSDYITYDLAKKLYKCLKTVIKANGHFNLVEVDSADGTKVIIRI